MVQQINVLAAKPADLSSIPKIHIVQGENWLLEYCPLPAPTSVLLSALILCMCLIRLYPNPG